MNIFMKYIYNKRRFNLKNWIEYRLFIRKLRKIMPDFGTLWQIADFAKLLEQNYFYDNSNTFNTSDLPSSKIPAKLFSSIKFVDGENGFCVNRSDVQIKFKLFGNNESILLEIERKNGNKLKSSMQFNDKDDINLSRADESLLEEVINITMNATIALLEYYYKKKEV